MPRLKLSPGSPAPDFDLPGVSGANTSLASLRRARLKVVVFSCNHCPYAQAYEERLVALQRDYQPKGVALVAINPNNEQTHPADSLAKMKERAAARGFNFPYLRDATQRAAIAFGAEFTPEVFVLDDRNVVRYVGGIDDNWEKPGAVRRHFLREALDALLAGQEPVAAVTTAVGCTIKWLPGNSPK
ncbi:MAG: thioredoxin family protein [Planctomycetes bacterium]|nr:thioredoxin family protein [Planctomycetota bacterium]